MSNKMKRWESRDIKSWFSKTETKKNATISKWTMFYFSCLSQTRGKKKTPKIFNDFKCGLTFSPDHLPCV